MFTLAASILVYGGLLLAVVLIRGKFITGLDVTCFKNTYDVSALALRDLLGAGCLRHEKLVCAPLFFIPVMFTFL